MSHIVFTTASDTGSFIVVFRVRALITTTNQGTVHCKSAPGACLVVGANVDNQTEAAGVPIAFATG